MKRDETLDEETTRAVERMVVLRLDRTINIWMRQLEMESGDIAEQAGLMGLQVVKKEIENERHLEAWARRCTTHG